ncbi:hypothetical protein [Sandarakinorhabdus sp.]|uniref:hypothetical protein n=1 Tax=Sandarakinorhabdus sp. TaxID=1916663 RepID=UPI00286E1EF1|nr:hypothetical protein [Sandarakinorhabdus sp.]
MQSQKITDEKAADIAIKMSETERNVIMHCWKEKSWRYPRIAELIGASYSDVQDVGHKLQKMRLAYVSVVHYNGSAIFLNEDGEIVKRAVELLEKIRVSRSV